VYDPRDLSKPITIKKLDNLNLNAWIHYDDSCKILYVVNKAQVFTQFFFFHENSADGTPVLQEIDSRYTGSETTRYVLPTKERCKFHGE